MSLSGPTCASTILGHCSSFSKGILSWEQEEPKIRLRHERDLPGLAVLPNSKARAYRKNFCQEATRKNFIVQPPWDYPQLSRKALPFGAVLALGVKYFHTRHSGQLLCNKSERWIRETLTAEVLNAALSNQNFVVPPRHNSRASARVTSNRISDERRGQRFFLFSCLW